MTDPKIAPDASDSHVSTRVSSAIRLLLVVTFLFMSLKILRYGFLPPGDALRDAAQAISGKPFKDVIVMFPGYQMNHNYGWDWFVRQLHVHGGLSKDGVLAFSVGGLLFLLLATPLCFVRRPEAWMVTLLVSVLTLGGLMNRFLQGRPLIFTETVLMAILFGWHSVGTISWPKILLTCAGFALAVYLHGTWFLWALLPMAFFAARQWRAAISLSLCWVAGTLVGAALTGSPFPFLKQTIVIAQTVSQEKVPAMLTVGELQADAGEFTTLLIMFIIFWWRKGRVQNLVQSPLFWMMLIPWILSLIAGRFWVDWGLPAALVWMALELEQILDVSWLAGMPQRLVAAVIGTLSLFLVTTSDIDGRYTAMLRQPFTDFSQSYLKGWEPGKGGIFYGADMSFFYNTYYTNPEGNWKYIVGFEPAWMPPDDLKIYRDIQWNNYAWPAYEPWVKKMRPEDRLEITGGPQPHLPPLEWINSGNNVWVGRKPQPQPPVHGKSK